MFFINEEIGDKNYLLSVLDKYPDNKIFLGSDWHLFKKEVTGDPEKESTFNLNKYILKHNMKVKKNDIFIYLGDLAHKKCSGEHYERLREFINRLNGIKILIRGNHDLESDDYYLSCGFSFVLDSLIYKNILFTHRPEDISKYKNIKLNIHGHLHEFKVFWDGTDPKNHLGIYTEKHNVVSLKYILDHRKEIEDENINMFSQPTKHMKAYDNYVNDYYKIVNKFFIIYPEYVEMPKEERYFKQEEMMRKLLSIPEVRSNEQLIGWKQMKMLNKKSYNNLSFKPENQKDYYHYVLINKDNNLIVDLNPDLLDWKDYVYSHGKNVKTFMWSLCGGLYNSNDKSIKTFPQDKVLDTLKKQNLI